MITVIFLLYNAEKSISALVEALRRQRHPDHERQGDWLQAVFVDDRSRDTTAEAVRREFARVGQPENWRLEVHETNYGLSRTLNEALAAVKTPYVLTCHCDSFFDTDEYVAAMLKLLENNPDVAAITGQPTLPKTAVIPFAEKVNLVTNLMDVFPEDGAPELVSVGFAEGRCDAFRVEALRKVGFYDQKLRVAGEDQVIAAKLRAAGYRVCQAPRLLYQLSVSDEQDSISKLLRHQQLFGRAHPYVLLSNRGTASGTVGDTAGANRNKRFYLRFCQLISVAAYLWTLVALLSGMPFKWAILPTLAVFCWKAMLFARHLTKIPMTPKELFFFFGLQPALDIYYFYGLLQGFTALLLRGSEPIR